MSFGDTYEVGEQVLVSSALAFATVTDVEQTRTGKRYTCTFPEGDYVLRYNTGLCKASTREESP